VTPERPAFRYYVRTKSGERLVELREKDGAIEIEVDGTRTVADLTLLAEPSLHSLLVGGRSREMVLARKGDTVLVSLDGQTIEARVMDEVGRALDELAGHGGTGALEVAAPMPGVIVAVPVAPGDVVDAGQPVVVLEAMKMQNELTAEAPGVVEQVLAKPGESVQSGAVLVVLRPRETS
jgi:biotin carboxyl carrier protein